MSLYDLDGRVVIGDAAWSAFMKSRMVNGILVEEALSADTNPCHEESLFMFDVDNEVPDEGGWYDSSCSSGRLPGASQ